MFDEKFWTAVAFVTFVVLVFRPARLLLVKMLDAHTEKALERVHNAQKMYEQAQAALKEAQEKSAWVNQEVEAILQQAQAQAAAIIADAHKEVESMAVKKSDLLMQKVLQRQQQMVNAVKDQVVLDVMALVHKRLLEEMQDESQAQVTNMGIKSIKELIH